jgi:hypothetical protein
VLLTDRVQCDYRTTAPEYVLGWCVSISYRWLQLVFTITLTVLHYVCSYFCSPHCYHVCSTVSISC